MSGRYAVRSVGQRLHSHLAAAANAMLRAAGVALTLAGPLAAMTMPTQSAAQALGPDASPIKNRHIGASRAAATLLPRSEADQALVDNWPMYRTERGQTAFNDAMATLKATEGPVPSAQAFKGCAGLECNVTLPAIGADGWLQPGRIWVSPAEYVLIAHSPRLAGDGLG